DLLAGGKHRDTLNVRLEFGFDLEFELQCDCPCVVDLWLKFPPGLDKPVQDSNLSIHTDNPDLTPCFQNTILAWIPSIYLWSALPFYLLYLKHNKRGYIILSVLSRFKTLFGVLLWCVSWADLFYSFHELLQNRTPPPVYFVTPLIVGITVLLATLLIQYERLRGVQSSGVLITFWFLSVLCAVGPFRSKIMTTTAQ
ncbi:PREDICTED: canalicular multispecific organic anion transporter 2-like, partial [Pterocles gutturalis]|uniref:canalicular multispecific organic anion transporter 2-like n=1 Tax=Pterocles gutturalis TaxID=240206 RepID=UPI000528C295